MKQFIGKLLFHFLIIVNQIIIEKDYIIKKIKENNLIIYSFKITRIKYILCENKEIQNVKTFKHFLGKLFLEAQDFNVKIILLKS